MKYKFLPGPPISRPSEQFLNFKKYVIEGEKKKQKLEKGDKERSELWALTLMLTLSFVIHRWNFYLTVFKQFHSGLKRIQKISQLSFKLDSCLMRPTLWASISRWVLKKFKTCPVLLSESYIFFPELFLFSPTLEAPVAAAKATTMANGSNNTSCDDHRKCLSLLQRQPQQQLL